MFCAHKAAHAYRISTDSYSAIRRQPSDDHLASWLRAAGLGGLADLGFTGQDGHRGIE